MLGTHNFLVGFRRSLLTPGHIGIGVFRWTYDWPDRHRRVHRGLYLLNSPLLPLLHPLLLLTHDADSQADRK
jgi:hypothetical protein